MGQQYLQIYGVPGTTNTAIYPYGQLGQAISPGHANTALQGYALPGHHIVHFGGPSANAMTTSHMSSVQVSYPTGKLLLPSLKSLALIY